eukprot:9551212-Heterocapsa_arctica.AAC.1
MAGAGQPGVYTETLSGPRLGRAADGGNPSLENMMLTIDEMEHELLKTVSVLNWFTRQFWRLRYAGTHVLVRHRLLQQLDHVQQCLDVKKLPVPVLRGKLADGA